MTKYRYDRLTIINNKRIWRFISLIATMLQRVICRYTDRFAPLSVYLNLTARMTNVTLRKHGFA